MNERCMPLRVYLAGPAAELDRVCEASGVLIASSCDITEPWWGRVAEATRRGWTHDSDVPADYMREGAQRNQRGIDTADVVIALARSTGGFSSGCAGEIGYAIAIHYAERVERDRNVIILVGDMKGFIWSHLACVIIVPTMGEALKVLHEPIARRVSV